MTLKPDASLHHAPEAPQRQLESAARILRGGGVIAIPTDTLYGLAADSLNERAVRRVFRLKGRPSGMALPLLMADTADLAHWTLDVPDAAWALAQRFWPGALTLVLRKANTIPDVVSGGMDTIALRVPAHEVPRAIAAALGRPITGTSANRTGRPGMTSADDVRRELADDLDLLVEGECAQGALASTVLALTGARPTILRAGAVTREAIEEVCGGVDIAGGEAP